MIALVVVPALVALATLVSRRFGHGVGGVMAGLPLTSGPLSLALAIEHGSRFAADAAVGSLVGIAASTAACVAYGLTARRGWRLATAVGLAAFAVGVTVGLTGPATLASAAIIAAGAALTAIIVLGRLRGAGPGARPQLALLPRVLSAFTVVVVVLLVARTAGAELAGALTPLPVVIGVLAVHAQREEGPDAAVDVLHGSQRGTFGFIVFFALAGTLLDRGASLWGVYGVASAGALLGAVLALPRGRR